MSKTQLVDLQPCSYITELSTSDMEQVVGSGQYTDQLIQLLSDPRTQINMATVGQTFIVQISNDPRVQFAVV